MPASWTGWHNMSMPVMPESPWAVYEQAGLDRCCLHLPFLTSKETHPPALSDYEKARVGAWIPPRMRHCSAAGHQQIMRSVGWPGLEMSTVTQSMGSCIRPTLLPAFPHCLSDHACLCARTSLQISFLPEPSLCRRSI